MTQKIKIAFWAILVLIILNCGVIFASSTVKYDLEDFVNKFPYIPDTVKQTMLNTSNWQSVETWNEQYDYVYIYAYFGNKDLIWREDTTAHSFIGFGFTNSSELNLNLNSDGYRHNVVLEKVQLFNGDGTPRNNEKKMDFNTAYGFFVYSEPNLKGSFNGYDTAKDRWQGIKAEQGMEYTYNRSEFSFDMSTVNYLDGYSPAPDLPYFEYSQEIISDYITLSNSNVIDGFNYNMTVVNNRPLGSLYSNGNDVMIIYLYKFDLKGNKLKDFSRVLYEYGKMVNGAYNGYLDMVEVFPDDGYYRFNLYYPKSFMEPYYIYGLSIQKSDGIFLETEPFALFDVNEPVILPDEEVDNIISGEQNISNGDMLGTITGSINDLNNNINNTIQNTILGEENESGDRQGGLVGGILDGIKGLFIPSNEEMSEWLSRTQAEVTDKLGILGEPINFFSRLMNKLVTTEEKDFILHIPELIIPGTDYKILDEFDINFTEMINEHEAFKIIYNGYIVIISGIMVYCFYSYLWSFYDHLLGSRSVESSYQIIDTAVEDYNYREKERNRKPIGFTYRGDNRK